MVSCTNPSVVSTGESPPRYHRGPAAAPPERGGHFRQWTDDIRQLVGVTPDAHRMVAGWPRLQPDGPGAWDRQALDRCDRVLDSLLELGLRPGLTLLDRSLPPWLEASGGWLARDTAEHFAAYAAELGRRFGDRVTRWITSTDLAGPTLADHVAGMYTPGRGIGRAGLPTVHHILLANGLATQALRAAGASGRIGATVTLVGGYPATDDPFDRLALERLESWTNRLFLDPMLLGEHMVTEDDVSPVEATGCARPGDLEIIATTQDMLGLSWHTPFRVTAPENLPHVLPADKCQGTLNEVNRLLVGLGFAITPFDDVETTAYGWPSSPRRSPTPSRTSTTCTGSSCPRCPSSTTAWAIWTWSTRRGTATTPGAGHCCAPGCPGWAG